MLKEGSEKYDDYRSVFSELSQEDMEKIAASFKKFHDLENALPDALGAEQFVVNMTTINRWDLALTAFSKFDGLSTSAKHIVSISLKKSFPELKDVEDNIDMIKETYLLSFTPEKMYFYFYSSILFCLIFIISIYIYISHDYIVGGIIMGKQFGKKSDYVNNLVI